MRKLYIVGPKYPNNGFGALYYAIADDGECLASHFCSHQGYAEGDLYSNRPERKELWAKKFNNEPFEVECIFGEDPKVDELRELNRKRVLPSEENHASVEIELTN